MAGKTRLRAKDDELKMLKARLVLREKRLQDESRRRAQEIEKVRHQVAEEVQAARARYDAERESAREGIGQTAGGTRGPTGSREGIGPRSAGHRVPNALGHRARNVSSWKRACAR